MRVHVLFFGMLKDITGVSRDQVELPGDSRLSSVFDLYASRFPRFSELSPSIVIARNQQFSPRDTPLSDGDEVAFLPPVSGGSGPFTHEVQDPEGHFFALTRHPIDERELRRRLLEGRDGAVVTFEGVVRDNSKGRRTRYLDYECYEAMAINVMAGIGREIASAHSISRIGIVHRLGRMEIGEASVVIVVTSPHRRPAFDAALEGINRLKKTVPIWKKEYFEDGEVWVEGEWDAPLLSR
ncbi:MAG: molybdenum cofactor biosynthesis protein MoaE [Bryobacteraceae bacterium]|nr:molybdenum cofactor biosynthesis protein MoaE [Bryobacteraceae bacterium]